MTYSSLLIATSRQCRQPHVYVAFNVFDIHRENWAATLMRKGVYSAPMRHICAIQ